MKNTVPIYLRMQEQGTGVEFVCGGREFYILYIPKCAAESNDASKLLGGVKTIGNQERLGAG
jgi:hypothetical protein